MATEKQIAANRANAKRSTGPKTAAGRAKSSRNAYRHGLSGDVALEDPALQVQVNLIAEALLADQTSSDDNLIAAAEFAEAQVKLLEIRKVRQAMLMELQSRNLQDFSRLAALDRYERLAHTRRRRASAKLPSIQK